MVMGGTLVARPGVNVNGNGFQIMFMEGGRADFQGSKVFTWSGNGSNANLKRDINFTNMKRIMFHQGAGKSTLRYVAVRDSGGTALGDYPIHFHLNGNSTRGTLVEGVVVVNSKHHAFVPHGSHGITFRDTIAKNVAGTAYWWDPGRGKNCSDDILYDHALADHVTNTPGDDRGFRLEAFRLGCGRGNVIQGSIALNVNPTHPKDCSGFHWPENDEGIWRFSNNASFGSKCEGIFIWQNTDLAHLINGYRGDPIENGAYVNRYVFSNIDTVEIVAHALGHNGGPVIYENGSVDTVYVPRHTLEGKNPIVFRDLQIGRFIVDNASNGGTMPGRYLLDNTNLACGDIEYISVVPGTSIVVDGVSC